MGIFDRRKPESEPTRAPKTETGVDPSLSTVMDAAAGMLRAFGKLGFDIEGRSKDLLTQECERWAQHLLVGEALPGAPPDRRGLPVERRGWGDSVRFLAESRKREAEYVARSFQALHDAVWTFVQTLDGVIVSENTSDKHVGERMERLKVAARGSDPELLRREVSAVAEEISRVTLEKKTELHSRVEKLQSQVADLCSELETARAESKLDALTRVYNRGAFDERTAQVMAMGRLFDYSAVLLLIDIDHFKRVNDTYGHRAGDAVIVAIANLLGRTFRVRSDFVARYGGEEFAVILHETEPAKAAEAAGRVLATLRATPVEHDGKVIKVTASIGVATLTAGDTIQSWIERADKALYEAKEGGRDRVVVGPAPAPAPR